MAAQRDFSAELRAAREAGDWKAHERIWEERRCADVAADEAALADIACQAIEQSRASVMLSAPCGAARFIGKLVPAPDNSANRAAWQRRKAMVQADRLEQVAVNSRVLAAGRAS